ncbi:MAG: hypothetical protein BYD32DRAFT_157300 [Podila humilis]|nr:MAG: hypothetical protein BYD32DRAFT_157300 [Podila humilis]
MLRMRSWIYSHASCHADYCLENRLPPNHTCPLKPILAVHQTKRERAVTPVVWE